MKANELMIGDWVNVSGEENRLPSEILKLLPKIGRVVGLDGDTIHVDFVDFGFMLGDVRPIPLTPEILEKNGWERTASDFWQIEQGLIGLCWERHTGRFFMIDFRPLDKIEADDLRRGLRIRLHFVHELQHALRLCGIEKEIEL